MSRAKREATKPAAAASLTHNIFNNYGADVVGGQGITDSSNVRNLKDSGSKYYTNFLDGSSDKL